jgi:hypothetical protein
VSYKSAQDVLTVSLSNSQLLKNSAVVALKLFVINVIAEIEHWDDITVHNQFGWHNQVLTTLSMPTFVKYRGNKQYKICCLKFTASRKLFCVTICILYIFRTTRSKNSDFTIRQFSA